MRVRGTASTNGVPERMPRIVLPRTHTHWVRIGRMAGTSAAYLVIRKQKARKDLAAEVSGIDIETEDDGDVVIRNAKDGSWVATLEDCQLEGERQKGNVEAKLEYLDVEEGVDGRIVKRIRSVLSDFMAK